MNDEAVYRTAPATPGLLIAEYIFVIIDIFEYTFIQNIFSSFFSFILTIFEFLQCRAVTTGLTCLYSNCLRFHNIYSGPKVFCAKYHQHKNTLTQIVFSKTVLVTKVKY